MSKKVFTVSVIVSIILFTIGNLYIFLREKENISTKETIWSSQNTNFIDLVSSEGILYGLNLDGNIYAIDPLTGQTITTLAEKGNINDVILADEHAIYYTSHIDNKETGIREQTLYAVNKKTNATLWKYSLPEYSSLRVSSGKVFVTPNDTRNIENNYIVLDAITGQRLWMYNLPPGTGNNELTGPIVSNNKVVIGIPDRNILYALQLDTGEVIWEISINLSGMNQPIVASDTMLFINSGSYNPPSDFLYAFDLESGKEKWKIPVEGNFGRLALTSTDILLAKDNTYLYSIDQQSGSVRWKIKTDDKINVISSGENIYMTEYKAASLGGTDYNKITKIESRTGEKVWQYKKKYENISSVTVMDKHIYMIKQKDRKIEAI